VEADASNSADFTGLVSPRLRGTHMESVEQDPGRFMYL
jgi:hypothetical protein